MDLSTETKFVIQFYHFEGILSQLEFPEIPAFLGNSRVKKGFFQWVSKLIYLLSYPTNLTMRTQSTSECRFCPDLWITL